MIGASTIVFQPIREAIRCQRRPREDERGQGSPSTGEHLSRDEHCRGERENSGQGGEELETKNGCSREPQAQAKDFEVENTHHSAGVLHKGDGSNRVGEIAPSPAQFERGLDLRDVVNPERFREAVEPDEAQEGAQENRDAREAGQGRFPEWKGFGRVL